MPTPRAVQFVTSPHLRAQPRPKGRVRLESPFHHTALEGPRGLLEVLDYFRAPATLARFARAYPGVDREVVDRLQRHLFLLDTRDAPVIGAGLLSPADQPIGLPLRWPDLTTAAPGGFAVIGAPVDLGSGPIRGALHGPAEVRRAMPVSLAEPSRLVLDLDAGVQYDTTGLVVRDLGDLCVHAGEDLTTVGRRLSCAVDGALAHGLRPLVLGGDHSVTWPVVRALLGRHRALGIIHFDAHHDLYPSPAGVLSHGNPFRHALADPAVKVLMQIGLRTLEPVRAHHVPVHDPRLRYVGSRALRQWSPADVFQGLPTDIPYYVSFDVDCLLPACAPETGSPVPGGLDFYQGLDLLEHVAARFTLAGADFVEVASARGGGANLAAGIVARYLLALMLSGRPRTPLDTWLFDDAGSSALRRR